jgi:sugar phosphate isomerase/epimerase
MNWSRREFMATTASVAAAAVLTKGGGAAADPLKMPIGLQLYTVGDDLKKDLDGTLRTIAAIGYREVETAGLPDGHSAAELRAALDKAGLKCRSTHFPLPMLQMDLAAQIAQVQQLGADYLICSAPWVADMSRFKPPAEGQGMESSFMALMDSFTAEDWAWNAEQFNKIGAQVKTAGLQFGYHNHGVEFRAFDGKIAFDELLRNTDPDLVVMEMDCGWVANAGFDPIDYLQRYPKRFHLLHVKDLKKGFKPNTGFAIDGTEIGNGALDWQRIFKAAKNGGVRGYFVEQEPPYARPPLEEIKISYDYLHKLKV